MGRPRMRPLLPRINRFLVGDGRSRGGRRSSSSSAPRGVMDLRRARPERVRGDPRPFPWQGRESGHGRRRGPSLPPPLPPYCMQAGVPSTSSAPAIGQPAGRSEDVPPRFHDLVTNMVRSMVQWGVAAGVVTVVDGPNAIFRLHSKVTTPGSRTPARPRPRPRPRVARLASRSGASTRRRLCSSRCSCQRQHHRRR